MTKIIEYPLSSWDFRPPIERIFEVDDLSEIHGLLKSKLEKVTVDTDQDTEFHRTFYSRKDNEFMGLYEKFIKNFVKPYYNESIVYQKIPTFRVQIPNNLGVGEFHKDKDYNHSPEEINWWIPLTPAFGTNTVWIESEPDKRDYKPSHLNPGEILIFNGANLSHGNKINKTLKTRVSFDFRVVPLREFRSRGRRTLTHKIALDIGGYFEVVK